MADCHWMPSCSIEDLPVLPALQLPLPGALPDQRWSIWLSQVNLIHQAGSGKAWSCSPKGLLHRRQAGLVYPSAALHSSAADLDKTVNNTKPE